ncbi:hypothetical protein DM01DRAFT_1330746 [Hesseltinella vesiculosa]|uniref:DH domain-containing protein n=1 Tax=Hesseltinella vesiculosa TaxID=101127 RepID=A0A1X2GX12_9FUNG|nr:hypothetical protein DM01DRAFT_1330746 [Hesseltinella vesiculosa]
MPGLKVFEHTLKEHGFASEYLLNKEKEFKCDELDNELLQQTRQPLAQTIDIVIPRSSSTKPRQKLLNILGSHYAPILPTTDNDESVPSHEFVDNEEKREYMINELIKTEENFINKLRTLVTQVVVPIKRRVSDNAASKSGILSKYMCTNIFVNLESILEFHEQFYEDLTQGDFATACASHFFKLDHVHRHYLFKVNESIKFHKDQMRENERYKMFIKRVTSDPSFGEFQVHELLNYPWKRIVVYPMLIKDLRNLTSQSHLDFDKLTKAYGYANRAASVHQDAATHCATTCHRLYNFIRRAPDDVIKQKRNLIDHLDAVELDPVTGKLENYVTLFLLTDKILVAKRVENVKGADISNDNPINSFTGLTKNSKREKTKFKFAGWIGLQQVEMLRNPADNADTFVIRASADFQDEIKKDDVKRNDKYFQNGAHLFSCQKHVDHLIPWKDNMARFVDQFYKTQSVLRQKGDHDATYCRMWKDISHIYSNVFDLESYKKQTVKNNVLLVFADHELDLGSLLDSSSSAPWIIGLVRPDQHGLKLNVFTKVALTCLFDDNSAPSAHEVGPIDFATVLLNNLIACERKLRCSSTFKSINDTMEEQEADQRPSRFLSRSKRGSLSRSNSITNLGKLLSRSRSQSPSSLLSRVIPTVSKSTPSQGNSTTTSLPEPEKKSKRPRALSLSNDSSTRIGPFHLKPSTSSSSRRKHSFDGSFFKPSASSSTAAATVNTTAPSQPASAPSPTPSPSQPLAYMTRHRHSMSIFPTLRSSSPSPVQPSELPSPAYLTQQKGSTTVTSTPASAQLDTSNQRQLLAILQSALKPSTVSPSLTATVNPHHHKELLTQRRFSEALFTSPTSLAHSNTSSMSSSPVSSNSPSLPRPQSPATPLGTRSTRSSFSNTLSSYTSQSSRSTLSLEELDQAKSPYIRLLNTDASAFVNQQHDNSLQDDEVVRKVITDAAVSYRHPKSLAPPSDLTLPSMQSSHSTASSCTITPSRLMEKDTSADPNCQFFMDKKSLLGTQIQRVSERLPQHDADADMLNDLYQDTMDEAVSLITKQRMELEEIQQLLSSYRSQRQQANMGAIKTPSLKPMATSESADALFKRRLKETEAEREYWRRRAR